MIVRLLTEHLLEFLSLKGGCTGLFESTLVKMPHFWKSLVTAHIYFQKGDTALHISLRARSKRITELLLRNPRNSRLLYRPNKDGETPYSIDAYHQKQILSLIHGHSKSFYCFANSGFYLDPLKKANLGLNHLSIKVRV